MSELPSHFKGKEAIEHVAEAKVQGLLTAAEIHGVEAPGYLSAATDAARDTAMALLLIWTLLVPTNLPPNVIFWILTIFAGGWALWKCGRSAWLGWSRLERLHRILEQERWEIQHHRQQERDELRALYSIKGLEGKLLEDVLDVLMADDSRLLRIMVEEEMGLSLSTQEHPLKQAVGAFLGCLTSILICLIGFWLYPPLGILIASLAVIGFSGAFVAYTSDNKLIPAIIWNVGIAVLAFGFVYFFLQYLKK